MGEVVELFPEGRPEDEEFNEIITSYGKKINWGDAPPLRQAMCLVDLAKELAEIERYGPALDSLQASRRVLHEVEAGDHRSAVNLIIVAHYYGMCRKLYGADEELWPDHERNFLVPMNQSDIMHETP